ncbi:tryptophan 2,3-dioxygenase family protein [Streptomyces sp. NPDC057271]
MAASPDSLTYGQYLCLDAVLEAQHPVAEPSCHDEMLFIIHHQVAELQIKLLIGEIEEAGRVLRTRKTVECIPALERVFQVQAAMNCQWRVLETLSVDSFGQFRKSLAGTSGFQSVQYRVLEFLLGYRRQSVFTQFAGHPAAIERLVEASRVPSLYDDFIAHVRRRGHALPDRLDVHGQQDAGSSAAPELVEALAGAYLRGAEDIRTLFDCTAGIAEVARVWREQHLAAATRLIGLSPGTGGTSGASYLRDAARVRFFPELLDSLARGRGRRSRWQGDGIKD